MMQQVGAPSVKQLTPAWCGGRAGGSRGYMCLHGAIRSVGPSALYIEDYCDTLRGLRHYRLVPTHCKTQDSSWSAISKIPCYFPVYQGIRLGFLQRRGEVRRKVVEMLGPGREAHEAVGNGKLGAPLG